MQPGRFFQHQHVAALFLQPDGVGLDVPDDLVVIVFVHSQEMGVVFFDGDRRRSRNFFFFLKNNDRRDRSVRINHNNITQAIISITRVREIYRVEFRHASEGPVAHSPSGQDLSNHYLIYSVKLYCTIIFDDK